MPNTKRLKAPIAKNRGKKNKNSSIQNINNEIDASDFI